MADRDPEQPDTPPLAYDRRQKANRFGSWLGGWARDTFSREQLISSLKSFLWVAPLTILIWVYAEREQLEESKNHVVSFSIKSSDPRIIVTMIDPPEKVLMAELRGSRVQVEKVKDLLNPSGDQAPVTINISPDVYKPGGGPYTVPASILGDQDVFRNNAVTVSNVSPANLKFNVDVMVSEEVEVTTPPLSNFPNLAGAPVIEPRTVQVTGPKSTLDLNKARGDLRVIADFSNYKEMRVPDKHELTVPLMLAFKDPNVTIVPTTAKVSIDVRQLQEEFRLNSIPVYATYPTGLEKKYFAKCDANISFVTFLGPANVIAQMRENNPGMQPKARFEVSRPDANHPIDTELTAELKYDVPEGVEVSPADKKRTITYRLLEQKPEE